MGKNIALGLIGFFTIMVFAIPTIVSVTTGQIAWHFLNIVTFPIGKAITEAAQTINFDEDED